MSKYTVLIVEDEALIAEHIAVCLEEIGYTVANTCSSAEEALEELKKTAIDLVLLDINIHGALDGVDLAQEINKRYKIPFVYLTSNSDSKTIERVKFTEPSGFILKPYTINDLKSNIEIALFKQQQKNIGNSLTKTEDSFFVKDKSALIRVYYNTVLYAEALDNYTLLFTSTNEKHIVPHTLKTMEERLIPHGFFRTHRSFIVNLNKISKVLPKAVIIGEKEIPLSENNREELLKSIH